MVLTRSMMKKRSRQSFYTLDMRSGSSSVFIRKTKDVHGNTQHEVIDMRKIGGEQRHANLPRKRNSALFAQRFVRHRRSRGSSLWQSQTSQLLVGEQMEQDLQHRDQQVVEGTPQQEFQPISMPWWLRTFRGLENQVAREVRQMLALQLGLFEQFKKWDDDDRKQLLMSLPAAIGTLETIQSQTGELLAWIRRLQAILEQESVEKIQRQTGALVGWAQHLHAILEKEPVVALDTLHPIGDCQEIQREQREAPVEAPVSHNDLNLQRLRSDREVVAVDTLHPIADREKQQCEQMEALAEALASHADMQTLCSDRDVLKHEGVDVASKSDEQMEAFVEAPTSYDDVHPLCSDHEVDASASLCPLPVDASENRKDAACVPNMASKVETPICACPPAAEEVLVGRKSIVSGRALVDPLICESVAVPPYIRRSRSRGLSLVR